MKNIQNAYYPFQKSCHGVFFKKNLNLIVSIVYTSLVSQYAILTCRRATEALAARLLYLKPSIPLD